MIKRNLLYYLKRIILIIVFFLILEIPIAFADSSLYKRDYDIDLTDEEKTYILENPVIKAVSLNGAAPIQFMNDSGEIQGISIHVLMAISDMTGLEFEYNLHDSFDQIAQEDYDIFYGIPNHYADFYFDGMILSKPYLKTETILFFNSSVNFNSLQDKTYAAVKGSALPEGIKAENAIYFNTREESLNAVETGMADYGYGNAYSVAYYNIRNNYKNIVTVPRGKEGREYCIGFFKDDSILISIINKSIDSIDDVQMNNIILDVSSQIDRKISPSALINSYGVQIFSVTLIFISVLILSIIRNIRTNKILRIHNRRYETLAEVANEYFFEYFKKKDKLFLSEKVRYLFDREEDSQKLKEQLKNILSNDSLDSSTEIKIPLKKGGYKVFKTIFSYVCDDKEDVDSIIGKLVDISEEFTEKEKLISKTKTDGLTGLYNPLATRELIEEKLKRKENNKNGVDAFLFIDLDYFKEINDNLGHLTGDYVLQTIGESLKNTFRKTDIMGRVGGDEFCVYLKDIPSIEFVKTKCLALIEAVDNIKLDMPVSISIGVALSNGNDSYEELFEKADLAMYAGKHRGKGQIIFSNNCIENK
ncbi:MAG: GGDEF domain-containing protein [Tissierellia bacterium]|nr:GGDEF domain-containing protein [Tissierellia bacterium]